MIISNQISCISLANLTRFIFYFPETLTLFCLRIVTISLTQNLKPSSFCLKKSREICSNLSNLSTETAGISLGGKPAVSVDRFERFEIVSRDFLRQKNSAWDFVWDKLWQSGEKKVNISGENNKSREVFLPFSLPLPYPIFDVKNFLHWTILSSFCFE